MTRIAIDLNVRVRGNLTYAGFEDVDGTLPEDGVVEVYEPESGLAGTGRVVDVDLDAALVYIDVAWGDLRPAVSVIDALTTPRDRFLWDPRATTCGMGGPGVIRTGGQSPARAGAINGADHANYARAL